MPVAATSLKISRRLKSRIEKLARREGETPHSFMVRTLEEQVDAAERHQRFVQDAILADKAMQKTGRGYAMEAVHRYIEARVRGRAAKRPAPVRWQK